MSLLKAFRAGFVRRWHTHPDLAHTNDPIDGHSGRVARIILMLHPNPSIGLIRQALIHDDGESVTGDVGSTTKRLNPEWSNALADMETTVRVEIWGWGDTITLSSEDFLWLKFADKLDAYMWAKHHAPHVLSGDGWPRALEWLVATAIDFDVLDQVRSALGSTQ